MNYIEKIIALFNYWGNKQILNLCFNRSYLYFITYGNFLQYCIYMYYVYLCEILVCQKYVLKTSHQRKFKGTPLIS